MFDGHAFTSAGDGYNRGPFAVIDLDDDGDPDFVVSSLDAGLAVVRSSGHQLGAGETVRVGGVTPAIRPADLDGDGDLDLVVMGRYRLVTPVFDVGDRLVAGETIDVCRWLEVEQLYFAIDPVVVPRANDDPLASTWSLVIPSYLGTIEVAFDADGSPWSVATIDPRFSNAAATGDLDGDGVPDLLVAIVEPDVGIFRAEVGPEHGQWSAFESVDDERTGAIAVADVDLDGDQDVVAVAANDYQGKGPVRVLHGDGAGELLLVAEHPRPKGIPSVSVGDVTGDGLPEVFVGAWLESISMAVLLGTPGGTFEPWFERETFAQAAWVEIVDVTGDGVSDVAVAGPLWFRSVEVLVGRRGAPPGHETSWIRMPFLANRHVLLDGADGEIPDVLRRGEDGGPPTLLQNRGDGTFLAGPTFDGIDFDPWPPSVVVAPEPHMQYLLLHEVGDVDLRMLRRHGSTIEPFATVSVSPDTSCRALADTDADGDLDLVTVAQSAGGQWLESRMQVEVGGFDLVQSLDLMADGPEISGLQLGDIDGDGRVDAWALRGNESIVCWGFGDGTFAPPASLVPGSTNVAPERLLSFDGDGDGRRDFFLALPDGSTRVIRQSAPRMFVEVSPLPPFEPSVWTEPLFAASGDIDGDGDFDLVAEASDDGPIGWWENVSELGAIEFRPHVSWRLNYQLASPTQQRRLVDMDGDGRADVVSVGSKLRVIRSLAPLGTAPSDVTADGQVGIDDLSAILMRWEGAGDGWDSPYVVPQDIDRDHDVDLDDLIAVLAAWGPVP